ncbi:MAG: nucleotidyltransferase domain-containing protein [Thermoplasmatota archaeon]
MDTRDEGPFQLPPELRSEVLEMILPSEAERLEIQRTAGALVRKTSEILADLGLHDVEPRLVGSVAKGTMTNDPDLDLFLLFPSGTDGTELEEKGIRVGELLLTEPEKRYTQHPYLTGRFGGFSCDVVPCIDIGEGGKVDTAVDRTPLHTKYIEEHLLEEQKEEVVLLKSFLKGTGTYGAEDTVEGISGYMSELMIMMFSSFSGTIDHLAGLRSGVDVPVDRELVQEARCDPVEVLLPGFRDNDIDLEELKHAYRSRFGNDVWIVVDPVDSGRNVASPVSAGTLSHLISSSRKLRRAPLRELFHPFSKRPIPTGEQERFNDLFSSGEPRVLDLPGGDPGVVITQLRSTLRKLGSHLRRKGFDEVRIEFLLIFPPGANIDRSFLKARYIWSGPVEIPVILFVTSTVPTELPEKYIHWGPPLGNHREGDFRLKWGDIVRVDEEEKRLFVELRREIALPGQLIDKFWEERIHGSSLEGKVLMKPDGTGRIKGWFEAPKAS